VDKQELVMELWEVLNDVTAGLAHYIVENGGVVVVAVSNDDVNVTTILKEPDEDDYKELEALLDKSNFMAVFMATESDDEEELDLHSFLFNNKEGLNKAFDKIVKHLRQTGGIDIRVADILGV